MDRACHPVRAVVGTRKATCIGLPALPERDDSLCVDSMCHSGRPVVDLTRSIMFHGYNVIECDFQLSIDYSCPGHSDSMQKPDVSLSCCFVPDWFTEERERTVGFYKRSPADGNLRIAE